MWGQVAGGLASAGMGMLLAGADDERQLRQQEKINAQQMKYQKEMGRYNQEMGLKMWNDTNAEAQAQHYKNAGLNVGLMYGGSGAGGATANTAAGSGSGQAAPTRETGANTMGMGLQMANMQAQNELIKAQTEKTKTETENIGEGGVERVNKAADTTLKGASARDTEASAVGKEIANNVQRSGTTWDSESNGAGRADIEMEKLDNENTEKYWNAKAAEVGYKQMPEVLQIAWKNAASQASQAMTAKDKVTQDGEMARAKMALEKELYKLGLDQRKIEFITNNIFRAAELGTDIMTKGAAGKRDNRRLDQSETKMNEWREWTDRNGY